MFDEFAGCHTVVIAAAGIGRRQGNTAKSAIDLGEETVIQRQVRLVRERWPYGDVVAVVGHQHERVTRHLPPFVRVVLNERYEETNVARSLGLGLMACPASQAFCLLGDLVFNREALAGWPGGQSTILVESGIARTEEIGVVLREQQISGFGYGHDARWGGMALLAGRELHKFQKLALSPDYERKLAWETMEEVLVQGGKFRHVAPSGLALVEIDFPRDVAPARQLALENP